MTQWEWVPGYEGRYQVSRQGDVHSIRLGRNLTHQVDAFGYHRVELNSGGRRRGVAVHRLVAMTFLPAPLDGQVEVRHLDHDPANNSVENLSWGTHSDNMRDMIEAGRFVHFNSQKTKCPAGHDYSGRNGRGDRVCHQCRRESTRRFREKQRA